MDTRGLPALAAPGVMLNTDGSVQRSARMRGPDLDSAALADDAPRTEGRRLDQPTTDTGSGSVDHSSSSGVLPVVHISTANRPGRSSVRSGWCQVPRW